MTVAVKSPVEAEVKGAVDDVVRRARIAFENFREVSQERADEAVRALAWSIYKPEHARELAGVGIESNHPVIGVAVGDEHFARGDVVISGGGSAQMSAAVVVTRHAPLPDAQN